jgi:hypothetical protein
MLIGSLKQAFWAFVITQNFKSVNSGFQEWYSKFLIPDILGIPKNSGNPFYHITMLRTNNEKSNPR